MRSGPRGREAQLWCATPSRQGTRASPCLLRSRGACAENVLWDTLNFMDKARPTALYLFDDQCDARNCSGPNTLVAVPPSAATCDLVATGVLERVAAVYNGARQFSLYRRNLSFPIAHRGSRPLGCEFCDLHVAGRVKPSVFKHLAELRAEQRRFRPKHCNLPSL